MKILFLVIHQCQKGIVNQNVFGTDHRPHSAHKGLFGNGGRKAFLIQPAYDLIAQTGVGWIDINDHLVAVRKVQSFFDLAAEHGEIIGAFLEAFQFFCHFLKKFLTQFFGDGGKLPLDLNLLSGYFFVEIPFQLVGFCGKLSLRLAVFRFFVLLKGLFQRRFVGIQQLFGVLLSAFY